MAGRPLKSGLDYFQHDTTMSHDEKVEALESEYGNDGYATYCKLLEKIYCSDGQYCLNDPVKLLSAAKSCNVNKDRFLEIVDSCVNFGLFDLNIWQSERRLTSERIRRQIDIVHAERGRDRVRKMPDSDNIPAGELPDNNIPAGNCTENEIIHTEKPHIRVEESRGEERREKEGPQEFFHLSQKPIPIQNDGTSRIEHARAAWNGLAPLIGPECRLMAIQFKRDDLDDCLRIMSVYSDDEIAEAIQNYCNLKTDSEYDPPRYGGFVGFMRGGVEKFVTSANPQDIFKKRKGFETAAEREDRERAEALRRLGVEP